MSKKKRVKATEVVPNIMAKPPTALVTKTPVIQKDELKELKKKLRKIVSEKPVLPYPEEVKLQPWVKQLEAALK